MIFVKLTLLCCLLMLVYKEAGIFTSIAMLIIFAGFEIIGEEIRAIKGMLK